MPSSRLRLVAAFTAASLSVTSASAQTKSKPKHYSVALRDVGIVFTPIGGLMAIVGGAMLLNNATCVFCGSPEYETYGAGLLFFGLGTLVFGITAIVVGNQRLTSSVALRPSAGGLALSS